MPLQVADALIEARYIAVALNAGESDIEMHLDTRGRALVTAAGATLQWVREIQPLGTIGVAGQLNCPSDTLLVVDVDNLTTIDLNALIRHHHHRGAALTIATHRESFRMPFGEVTLQDGDISAYTKKPTQQFQVSSGLYVLGARARSHLSKNCRTDVPDLLTLLHEPKWAQQLGAAAPRRYRERYQPATIARQLEHLFAELIGQVD